MSCERNADVGAYLLHALSDDESKDFAAHLHTCDACQLEVRQLQSVVDTLPMAAPQHSPAPELKSRIMRVVESEAELLRATGPEADRVSPAKPARARSWRLGWPLRPLTAGVLASVLLAVGVAAGVALKGNSSSTHRTRASSVYQASVAPKGSEVSLTVTGDEHGSLRVVNLPSAPRGKVYQVWLQTADDPPTPTHTLFDVRSSDGSATVPIQESVRGVQHVLVTPEPDGGSRRPTGPIIIEATPTPA